MHVVMMTMAQIKGVRVVDVNMVIMVMMQVVVIT